MISSVKAGIFCINIENVNCFLNKLIRRNKPIKRTNEKKNFFI